MHYLYKTPRLIEQVLLVVFLLAVLGAQVVSAQTNLPPKNYHHALIPYQTYPIMQRMTMMYLTRYGY